MRLTALTVCCLVWRCFCEDAVSLIQSHASLQEGEAAAPGALGVKIFALGALTTGGYPNITDGLIHGAQEAAKALTEDANEDTEDLIREPVRNNIWSRHVREDAKQVHKSYKDWKKEFEARLEELHKEGDSSEGGHVEHTPEVKLYKLPEKMEQFINETGMFLVKGATDGFHAVTAGPIAGADRLVTWANHQDAKKLIHDGWQPINKLLGIRTSTATSSNKASINLDIKGMWQHPALGTFHAIGDTVKAICPGCPPYDRTRTSFHPVQKLTDEDLMPATGKQVIWMNGKEISSEEKLEADEHEEREDDEPGEGEDINEDSDAAADDMEDDMADEESDESPVAGEDDMDQ